MTSASFRFDGAPASAERFYQAACDPRRSAVIEACAGAGKTWMLVSRILRALLDGARPHEIVAITYTKKAAGEMRARLLGWVAEFSDPARCVAALRERGLGPDQAAALAPRLAALQQQVLDAERPVEIRTFHAWFAQLLRSAPLDLLDACGLHPDVELVEDPVDLMPELFRRFHAAVDADAALRADFVVLAESLGRASLRKWLDAALAKRIEIELADAAGTLEGSVPQDPRTEGLDDPAQALRAEPLRIAQLRRIAAELGRGANKTPREAAQALERALALAQPGEALEAARRALITGKGTVRKHLAAEGLADAAAWLEGLAAAVRQHHDRQQHLRMVRLTRRLFAEYAALKRRRSLADMADLERVALALLRDSASAGWVQQRLDARVRHLLIDEFQDTSPLQWQALQAWLSAYAGAGAGAPVVLIVGDPKQSIYRFRNAEPRVFAEARRFVVEALGGSVLECDHTRRNAPAVLDVLNPVFEAAAQAGRYDGYRRHSGSVQQPRGQVLALPPAERAEAPPGPARERWRDSLTEPRDRDAAARSQAEARAVAAEIAARVEAGTRPGDVMVLARRRETLRQLAAELRVVGLPYVAVEAQPLAESPEVRDLLALLDALASPGHDLSLAQALKSPLFGASDDDLQDLAEASGGPGGWRAALAGGAGSSAALERARAILAELGDAARRLPPHDLLDRVLHRCDAVARIAAALPAHRRHEALASIDQLLAVSLTLDGGRYSSVHGFVRALRSRTVKVEPTADPQATALLTIHGAKGLEARVVFVMDCDPTPRPPEGPTLLVDWPVQAAAPRCCAFLARESQVPAALEPVLQAERAAREREELNSLYVAMTRAREDLVLSRTLPGRPAPSSWWPSLEGHVPQRDAQAAPSEAPVPAALVPVSPSLELPAWQPDAPMPARADAARDSRAAALGSAVHRVLEWRLGGSAAAAPTQTLARAAARLAGLDAAAAAQVVAHVDTILHSPACRRFFPPAPLAWAGNEVVFADAGELLRLDRLVALDAGGRRQWWVLDYKLNRDPLADAEYLAQMGRYRAAVARANPGEAVHCAFVSGAGEVFEIEFTDQTEV